jgi:chitinase
MKFSSFTSALALGAATLFQQSSAAALPSELAQRATTAAFTGFNNVAYFVDWAIYGRNYQPQQLPINTLTHVLLAFADLRSDGTVYLPDPYADLEKHYPTDSWNDVGTNVYGIVKQLYLLKKQNRNLKTLLSIGGWTYSKNFPAPASTAQGRATFASTAVRFVQDLGLDGLDIDWEYPSNPDQARDFTLLLQETRRQLDAYTAKNGGNRMLLTVACPAGPTNYRMMDIRGMNQYVDHWNLMAYDYAGSFSGRSGHQANLYPSRSNPDATPFNTDEAVKYYISQGVPSRHINLGIPLYGRAFEGTSGLGKPYSGIGAGSWENGIWDYKALPRPGAQEMSDAESGATYSWDPARQTIVSYDTKDMAVIKKDYLLRNNLGGGMYWESSADRTDGGSIMAAVYNGLRAAGSMDNTQNTLSYPASKYDNMRKGMA